MAHGPQLFYFYISNSIFCFLLLSMNKSCTVCAKSAKKITTNRIGCSSLKKPPLRIYIPCLCGMENLPFVHTGTWSPLASTHHVLPFEAKSTLYWCIIIWNLMPYFSYACQNNTTEKCSHSWSVFGKDKAIEMFICWKCLWGELFSKELVANLVLGYYNWMVLKVGSVHI